MASCSRLPAGLVPARRQAGGAARALVQSLRGRPAPAQAHRLAGGEARSRALYAPHTEAAYRLPPWRSAFYPGAGLVTRRGLRAARRAGFLPPGRT